MRRRARRAVKTALPPLIALVTIAAALPSTWRWAEDALRRDLRWAEATARPGAGKVADARKEGSVRAVLGFDAIKGRARVIDGDSLDIGGVRIRLHGIDAPEARQRCRAGGRRWRCGREAARALADRIAGREVACQERDRDRYGRVVAVCGIAGTDLNRWMVARGWAFAYRRFTNAYVGEESEARTAGRGVWRGEVVPPWEWRRGKRLAAAGATTGQGGG